MKSKRNYLGHAKRLLSYVLVLALVVTSMPSTFFTPVFADEYVQKGRFLVVYEKGTDEVKDSFLRSVFNKEDEQSNEVKNGEIISEGVDTIALVNDSKMGISSTFRKDKILAIEEDKMVSLLDDENSASLENNDKKNDGSDSNEQDVNLNVIENENNTNENTEDNPVQNASNEETNNSQSTENENIENNAENKNEQDVDNPENPQINQDEELNVEENNTNVETNLPEENQEALAEEKAEIKNSLDKYIIDAKGKNIKIALIDSGVNVTTGSAVTLAGGKSFIDDNYANDENGHGTSLAGIIKGYELSDGTKFEGLAPNAELYSLKVLDSDGKGYYSDVIKALDWARENNIWVDVNESMSDFSRAYQKQVTGQEGKAFIQNGVKFDGMSNGVLLDVKGKYKNFVDKKTGEFYGWFKGQSGFTSQARRQINASNGAPISWYFAEEEVLNATKKLFQKESIKGIELIYKPFK